ncbi:MAG: helix-turn-helix domain-containing protein [Solirubrobacteraceae bacterium]
MTDLWRGLLTAADPDDLAELAKLLSPLLEPERREVSPAVMLTCSQAAQRAGTHVETIRRAVRSGALPAGRVGRSLRIAPSHIDAWLSGDRCRVSAPRPLDRGPRAGRSRAARRPLADTFASMEDDTPSVSTC